MAKSSTLSRSDAEVGVIFYELLEQLDRDTKIGSLVSKKFAHPAYRRIAALGPQVVPFILGELEKGRAGIWFQTLEDITGINPIHPDHESDSAMMIADWLEWGTNNGVI